MLTRRGVSRSWTPRARAVAVGIGAVALAAGISAQTPGQQPNTYGTSSLVSYTVNAWAFQEQDNVPRLVAGSKAERYSINGSAAAIAPLFLPSGAIIDHVELEACDASAGGDVDGRILRCTTAGCTVIAQTSTSGTPGCVRITAAPATTTVVDNQTNVYVASFSLGAASFNLSANAIRVYYQLQVSPGPAIATFLDVPSTSPQYKFVEALVAAGITAGCGGGNYCPAQPVTRGQMAVFLATALGLHFPD